MSDVSNEPDDQQSLVRFLTYANEFDVEGLIATTSCWKQSNPDKATILDVVDAYQRALPNLRKHASGYPEADYLRRITKAGVDGYGMIAAEEQLENEGVQLIVSALKRDDPRPLWFCAWGGANTLGAAVLQLKKEHPADAARLLEKIRGYEIALQDDAFAFIANQYPNKFLISSQLAWKGISRTTSSFNAWSESWGGDNSLLNETWVQEQIQAKGPLGEKYPNAVYLWEGDTPSFLYLIPNGLSDPEQPHWGSWGGRFEPMRKENVRSGTGNETVDQLLDKHRPYRLFSEASDKWTYQGVEYHNQYAAVFRWRRAFQNDFAARMSWAINDQFTNANHNPIAVLNGDLSKRVLRQSVKSASVVELNAEGTSDPDGDDYSIRWWIYPEPSQSMMHGKPQNPPQAMLSHDSGVSTQITLPEVSEETAVHVVMEVEDQGQPNLYAYRRMVFHVQP